LCWESIFSMCDAPDCGGRALGRVLLNGQQHGFACSEACALRVGTRIAAIGAPLTSAEIDAKFRRVFDRIEALERALGLRAVVPPASAAAAAAPASSAAAPPIAVVPIGNDNVQALIEALRGIVSGRSVIETTVDRLVPGQRTILAVYAATVRSPTGQDALQRVEDITRITGRRPLVLVGVFGGYSKLEEWTGFDRTPADRFDGIVRFTFLLGGRFQQWRDGTPSAARILGSD